MWLLVAVALAADPPAPAGAPGPESAPNPTSAPAPATPSAASAPAPEGAPAASAPASTSAPAASTAAAPAGPALATTDAPRVTSAATLRRTCDHGQLCDGRCVPWSETCATAVRDSVALLVEADRVEARNAALCDPAPGLPAPPPIDPGLAMLRDSVLLMVCEAASDERDPDCAAEIRAQALANPARSVCTDPPVIAPGPGSEGR